MAVYGFGRENAANLLKVARREGLGRRREGGASYPEILPGLAIYVGKTTVAHNKGAAQPVSRYYSDVVVDGTGDLVDTTEDDTVFNLFADVATGKWCIYVAIGITYWMIAAEC